SKRHSTPHFLDFSWWHPPDADATGKPLPGTKGKIPISNLTDSLVKGAAHGNGSQNSDRNRDVSEAGQTVEIGFDQSANALERQRLTTAAMTNGIVGTSERRNNRWRRCGRWRRRRRWRRCDRHGPLPPALTLGTLGGQDGHRSASLPSSDEQEALQTSGDRRDADLRVSQNARASNSCRDGRVSRRSRSVWPRASVMTGDAFERRLGAAAVLVAMAVDAPAHGEWWRWRLEADEIHEVVA